MHVLSPLKRRSIKRKSYDRLSGLSSNLSAISIYVDIFLMGVLTLYSPSYFLVEDVLTGCPNCSLYVLNCSGDMDFELSRSTPQYVLLSNNSLVVQSCAY